MVPAKQEWLETKFQTTVGKENRYYYMLSAVRS